jgi:hypothetical protein
VLNERTRGVYKLPQTKLEPQPACVFLGRKHMVSSVPIVYALTVLHKGQTKKLNHAVLRLVSQVSDTSLEDIDKGGRLQDGNLPGGNDCNSLFLTYASRPEVQNRMDEHRCGFFYKVLTSVQVEVSQCHRTQKWSPSRAGQALVSRPGTNTPHSSKKSSQPQNSASLHAAIDNFQKLLSNKSGNQIKFKSWHLPSVHTSAAK